MLEHPDITNVNRTGYTAEQWQDLKRKTLAKSYMEDIYGEEIKPGDDYYENELGEIIHEKNLATYAIEYNGLIKYEKD